MRFVISKRGTRAERLSSLYDSPEPYDAKRLRPGGHGGRRRQRSILNHFTFICGLPDHHFEETKMATTQPTRVHNGAKPMDTAVPTVPALPESAPGGLQLRSN